VGVQFYGVPRIVQRISAGAFYPAPEVDSAVVRIDVPAEPRVVVADVDLFFRVAKAGFGQKRKQLHNALKAEMGRSAEEIDRALLAAQIDPKRRAETLTIEEWVRLSDQLSKDRGLEIRDQGSGNISGSTATAPAPRDKSAH
jgi:16S rRNA (adenine1518-N6/adenine1519-N6)-dimethyltransferase